MFGNNNLNIKSWLFVLLLFMNINPAVSQDTRIRYIGYEIELIDNSLIQFWEEFADRDETIKYLRSLNFDLTNKNYFSDLDLRFIFKHLVWDKSNPKEYFDSLPKAMQEQLLVGLNQTEKDILFQRIFTGSNSTQQIIPGQQLEIKKPSIIPGEQLNLGTGPIEITMQPPPSSPIPFNNQGLILPSDVSPISSESTVLLTSDQIKARAYDQFNKNWDSLPIKMMLENIKLEDLPLRKLIDITNSSKFSEIFDHKNPYPPILKKEIANSIEGSKIFTTYDRGSLEIVIKQEESNKTKYLFTSIAGLKDHLNTLYKNQRQILNSFATPVIWAQDQLGKNYRVRVASPNFHFHVEFNDTINEAILAKYMKYEKLNNALQTLIYGRNEAVFYSAREMARLQPSSEILNRYRTKDGGKGNIKKVSSKRYEFRSIVEDFEKMLSRIDLELALPESEWMKLQGKRIGDLNNLVKNSETKSRILLALIENDFYPDEIIKPLLADFMSGKLKLHPYIMEIDSFASNDVVNILENIDKRLVGYSDELKISKFIEILESMFESKFLNENIDLNHANTGSVYIYLKKKYKSIFFSDVFNNEKLLDKIVKSLKTLKDLNSSNVVLIGFYEEVILDLMGNSYNYAVSSSLKEIYKLEIPTLNKFLGFTFFRFNMQGDLIIGSQIPENIKLRHLLSWVSILKKYPDEEPFRKFIAILMSFKTEMLNVDLAEMLKFLLNFPKHGWLDNDIVNINKQIHILAMIFDNELLPGFAKAEDLEAFSRMLNVNLMENLFTNFKNITIESALYLLKVIPRLETYLGKSNSTQQLRVALIAHLETEISKIDSMEELGIMARKSSHYNLDLKVLSDNFPSNRYLKYYSPSLDLVMLKATNLESWAKKHFTNPNDIINFLILLAEDPRLGNDIDSKKLNIILELLNSKTILAINDTSYQEIANTWVKSKNRYIKDALTKYFDPDIVSRATALGAGVAPRNRPAAVDVETIKKWLSSNCLGRLP